MESKRMTRFMLVLVIAFASLFGLVACSSVSGGSGGVAATVNGTEIMEDDVTKYIANFRKSSNLEDDQQWVAWMEESGMTPQAVREQVIDYFKNIELVKIAAKEKGVTVDKAEVDEQIEAMKANYGNDEGWQNALSTAGTTEEEYRENIEFAMIQQKLQELVVEENAPEEATDEQIIAEMETYVPLFDGAKRSSHILFNSSDEAQAQEVLNMINGGELDFADAAKQYSIDTASAENGGDVGWDRLNAFVTEYTNTLNELGEGQVSALVTSDYGIHIIKCTEVFYAPEVLESLDQLPEALVSYVRDLVNSNLLSAAYTDWMKEYSENAEVVINDMPSGLPYDVEMNNTSTDNAADDQSAAIQEESPEVTDGGESAGDAE